MPMEQGQQRLFQKVDWCQFKMKRKIRKASEVEVDFVKIIGRLKGTDERIELILDKKAFDEWWKKLK